MQFIIPLGEPKPYLWSICLCLAVFTCFTIYSGCERSMPCDRKRIHLCMPFLLLGVLIGGKLLSLFTRLNEFMSMEGSIWQKASQLGFVFYGGLLGALCTLWCFTAIRKESLWKYTDTICYVLPIGQAIGRIGCLFNYCCYGKEYNDFLAVKYVVAGEVFYRFPVQLLEAVGCLLLGVLLLKKRNMAEGMPTAHYCVGYGLLRFIVEFFRGDEIRGVYGYISTSQIISILLLGYGLFFIKNKRKERKYTWKRREKSRE